MIEWSTAAPAIGSAFLASAVEIVEAFTIILAVATLRGWRPAVCRISESSWDTFCCQSSGPEHRIELV